MVARLVFVALDLSELGMEVPSSILNISSSLALRLRLDGAFDLEEALIVLRFGLEEGLTLESS